MEEYTKVKLVPALQPFEMFGCGVVVLKILLESCGDDVFVCMCAYVFVNV